MTTFEIIELHKETEGIISTKQFIDMLSSSPQIRNMFCISREHNAYLLETEDSNSRFIFYVIKSKSMLI